MHPLRLAFCALSLLVLQSCDDVTRDLILRSNSQAILPLGPVHTPPADSLSRVQTSLSLSGMSGGEVPMALQKNSSGSGTASSDLVGPARLSISPLQASGALSFWVADHFRFGAGVEVGGTGAAGSLETGLRFGRALSVEGFCGVGMASVHSAVDWDLFTRHSEDDGGGPNDTSHTYQSQEGEESHLFTRAAGSPLNCKAKRLHTRRSPHGKARRRSLAGTRGGQSKSVHRPPLRNRLGGQRLHRRRRMGLPHPERHHRSVRTGNEPGRRLDPLDRPAMEPRIPDALKFGAWPPSLTETPGSCKDCGTPERTPNPRLGAARRRQPGRKLARRRGRSE